MHVCVWVTKSVIDLVPGSGHSGHLALLCVGDVTVNLGTQPPYTLGPLALALTSSLWSHFSGTMAQSLPLPLPSG